MNSLLKKTGYFALTFYLIVTLTFFLMKMLPGDPFTQDRALPQEVLDSLMRHYGLDKPISEQYLIFLKSIAHFDFGPSIKYKSKSVTDIIFEGFPVSAFLGLQALLLSVSFGLMLGTISALWHKQWQDHVAMFLAVICISTPSFIMATLLQYVFALKLDLFPIARWETWMHSFLPTLALAALPTAFIARLTRSNMLEVLQQDYIKAARAKGLSSFQIVRYHALRNACLPVIAYFGQLTANILTGSFIIEKIYAIPGLGQWFVMSISNRDYTVIMGMTIFYSLIMITAGLLADVLYVFFDPRIKKHEFS